ncbi:hypothetical protein T4E_2386 [Trichinella pseudospiralis]|uniref:Uncharacterized protein n=1 Tax=Trichinella pseudospiralis TaxID=6337 RepID=A0A0V0XEH7_TRIPS|nr:hypothetical protein T4E_2386 [Trichinella pseudospiralis]
MKFTAAAFSFSVLDFILLLLLFCYPITGVSRLDQNTQNSYNLVHKAAEEIKPVPQFIQKKSAVHPLKWKLLANNAIKNANVPFFANQ